MESVILILIIIIISYFVSKYIIGQYPKNNSDNSTMLQMIFGITSFFTISYIVTYLQKSGPARAMFIESIIVSMMLPFLPFILIYRYLFE
jgi:hypothetical protein